MSEGLYLSAGVGKMRAMACESGSGHVEAAAEVSSRVLTVSRPRKEAAPGPPLLTAPEAGR
jgi:hypothetical protein